MKTHEHRWVQERVTLWPAPVPTQPFAGASVTWRCTIRRCNGKRSNEYRFRRPGKNVSQDSDLVGERGIAI